MEYFYIDTIDETNIIKKNLIFNIIILLFIILSVTFSVLRYLYRNDDNSSNRKLTSLYGFYISIGLVLSSLLYYAIKN